MFQANADLDREQIASEAGIQGQEGAAEHLEPDTAEGNDVILVSMNSSRSKSQLMLAPTLEGLEEAGRFPLADDDGLLCETL